MEKKELRKKIEELDVKRKVKEIRGDTPDYDTDNRYHYVSEEDILELLDKAREEGRREALETLHLKLNDCTDIMAKIEKIIDHLNSQSQPEENEEWEKRFIRTFGYWGEEIKFIKQLLKEREREVLEDIKVVNNEIYEGRTEILEVEIDNRLDKLNKEEK